MSMVLGFRNVNCPNNIIKTKPYMNVYIVDILALVAYVDVGKKILIIFDFVFLLKF